jgi:hypothetical protein
MLCSRVSCWLEVGVIAIWRQSLAARHTIIHRNIVYFVPTPMPELSYTQELYRSNLNRRSRRPIPMNDPISMRVFFVSVLGLFGGHSFEVNAEMAEVRFTVKLIDADGAPLANADVRAAFGTTSNSWAEGHKSETRVGRTNTDGRVSFSGTSAGGWGFMFQADGY